MILLSSSKKYSLLTILIVILVFTITNSSKSAEKPLKSPVVNMPPEKSLDNKSHPKRKKSKQDTKTIVFKDGKLTVKISAPLKVVMEKISELTGVEVAWVKSDIYEQVSVGFSDRALDEAVKHILDGKNYMLLYRSTDEGEKLARILILPHVNGEEVPVHYVQPHVKNHIPPMAKQSEPVIRQQYHDEYEYNTFTNHKNIDPVNKGRHVISKDENGDRNTTSAPDEMAKGQPHDTFDMNNKNVIGRGENNSSPVTPYPDENVIVIKKPADVWDDFEYGDANEWQPDNADHWTVERVEDQSEYCMMPSNREIPSISLRADLDVTNSMTISVKAKALEQGDDDDRQQNFFIVFGFDEDKDTAYFVGANLDKNTWVIEERSLSYNSSKVLDEELTDIININTWYDLKLVISGATVDLYARESAVSDYGEPKASFDFTPENGFPDGIPGGKIGLGGIYNLVHFDDFSVTY